MSDQTFLNNHFLIAMPGLNDPYFSHSVTFLCEHNENGAIGIIINRPLRINLSDVLINMDIFNQNQETNAFPILFGGPLHQERGFVIHSPEGNWRSTYLTDTGIAVTTSRDILQAVGKGSGPEKMIVTLGCSGWKPGQLEEEIANNFWLSSPADSDIIFKTPFEQRWHAAAALLGIDINTLTSDSGHA